MKGVREDKVSGMGLRRDLLVFPGGKEKALTFSYDDAVTQDVRFLEMLNERGLKGTFNINTGLLGQCSLHTQDGKTVTHDKLLHGEIASTYEGHELAVHGLTHLDLVLVPEGTAAYELTADRAAIEEIVQAPVRGMAYPFGTYNEKVLEIVENCGIEYARTVKSTGSFEIPENFRCWHPTCHHADERLFDLLKEFCGEDRLQKDVCGEDASDQCHETDYRYTGPKLFYVWGHTYEFDVREDWERMERFLDQAAGHEDVWYATNIEICDYVNAAKQLKYSAAGKYIYNPTVQDIWMRLDPKSEDVVVLKAGEVTRV